MARSNSPPHPRLRPRQSRLASNAQITSAKATLTQDIREDIRFMTTSRLPLRTLLTISLIALLAWCALPVITQPVMAQAPAPVKYDSGTVSGLTARNIGSATMGGRIAAIDAVDEN